VGGVVGGTARTGVRLTRSGASLAGGVAAGSLSLARSVAAPAVHAVAVPVARSVGTAVTGADPLPDGHVRSLAGVARGMLEPPMARHRRRVWADHGHAHVELAAPSAEDAPAVRQALRRELERLEGVQWATVNDVVGRVLVAFDERRVGVEDVVGVVTAVEQARGGRQVFPQHEDHPGDLEPLLAAAVAAAVDLAALGVALGARRLPVPRLSRHATLAIALLEGQPWLRRRLSERIGPVGTDLALSGTSALLHALAQSPVVPALNAAAALQQVLELRARRQVWRRREPELCGPPPEDAPDEPVTPPGERPGPLPDGPIERYLARLGPTELGGALVVLLLTRSPGRAADLMKALTPKSAVLGREAFAAALDLLMCRRDVLPMDGSAYRRLDRVDTVVVDGATLCTGPPVVVEVDPAPGQDCA
jgi:cation-transporting ATPase I